MQNIGIAIIAEGITDQVVVEKILRVHYKDDLSPDELYIQYIQPHRDATDNERQADESHGGWKNVLECLQQYDIIADALSTNKKLVIQIDGDICFDDSISIDPSDDCDAVCNKIIALLKSQISTDLLSHIEDRLLFAIPLHSTECWLIPLYSEDMRYCAKKSNCENHLITVTADKKIDCRKNHANYTRLVQPMKKSKNLDLIGEKSRSFQKFRDSLPKFTEDLVTSVNNNI